jgi:hypothetical protein
MHDLFEWDDSVERSGLNRMRASSATDGAIVLTTIHAGTGVSISLPRYAVSGLVIALMSHLDAEDA